LAVVCGLGLSIACSSTAAPKNDSGPEEDVGSPSTGETSETLPETGDVPEAGDGSTDGDATAGDAVATADADAAPEVALDVAPDLPRDLPVERPPTDLPNGEACQANGWCRSKFCVDGFCCNTACDGDDPARCTACSMAKTGQKNGLCAGDRSRERMKCGEACGQVLMNVPAVLSMICRQGQCVVPDVPEIVATCRKQFDLCTSSFCNQPTNRTARCVDTLCPQAGTCCCEMPGNAAARSCTAKNACMNDRACVSQ
jgi:hypothetical protein